MARASYYYKPTEETVVNLELMKAIDKTYTECPFYGSRRITEELLRSGYKVNRKRIQRLMRQMRIEVIYPRPNISKADSSHKKFPYLLKGEIIKDVNQVWCADITYIPLKGSFLYLVAILDLFSRYILTWRLSTNLECEFCIEALEEALKKGKPEIFNTDQGVQFTCKGHVARLESSGVRVSMDSKGRALDNIFVERFWRTLKYEEVYCTEYEDCQDATKHLDNYFNFYNNKRLHQALNYKTPEEVFLKADCAIKRAKFV